MIVALSSTSVSADVEVVDDSGLPVTGLVAATFPALTWSLAGANADNAWPALVDLAALTTAWANGGLKERGNGVYRVDLPNAMMNTAGEATIRAEVTGKHLVSGGRMDVGPQPANVQQVAGQTANAAGAVTFPAAIGTSTLVAGAQMDLVNAPNATALAAVAAAVWDTLTSGVRAAGSYGAKLKAWVLGTDFKAVLSTDAAQPAPSWWVAPDNPDVATALSDLVSLLGRTDPTTAISTLQTTANAIKAKTDQAQFQAGYVLATVYNGGTGAYGVTVHVTDGTNPIVGARVRLFAQGGQSFTGNTDASGNASFSLDAGSYTLTVTENGYSYAPTTQVIGGAATITAAMTQESVPAATLPGQTNAYLHTYDAGGNAAAGVSITFVLVSAPGQNSYGLTKTATSDGTGLLQISLLQNASYQARRGSGPWVPFTTGASGTYPLPQVLGDA